MNYRLNHELILASGSPRRREILSLLNIEFKVLAANIDESDFNKSLKVSEIPEFLAQK